MNKKVLSGMFIALALASCSKENIEEEYCLTPEVPTRSSSLEWDECEKCIISTGDTVNLPWANTTISQVPTEIRKDAKSSDGWRILYSNVRILGCEMDVDQQSGANYLILYNKYTGVLKGFYYAKSVQSNNHANWMLTIPQSNTKLFNFVNYFAEPANTTTTNQITLSNISTNGLAAGFDVGWNCFMQELAYDENSLNEELNVSGFSMNEVTYTFNGSYTSTSEGTLITTTQGSSTIMNGVANAVGNGAKSWIASNTSTSPNDGKPIKSNVASTILQGITGTVVPSIVSWGLNKVFGSLLGQNITNQNYSLQYSTNGTATITGSSTQPSTGYIIPLSGISLDGIGEQLGVWNLAEAPKYLIKTCPELVSIRDANNMLLFQYLVKGTPSIQAIRNPNVNANIVTSYSLVEYEKYDGVSPSFFTRNSYNSALYFPPSDPGTPQEVIYDDTNTIIKTMPQNYMIYAINTYPNRTSTKDVPAYDFSTSNWEIRHRIAFKVVTTLNISGGGYVCSAKTFIPENKFQLTGSDRPYTWSYQALKAKGY